jgi:hypothetical protein
MVLAGEVGAGDRILLDVDNGRLVLESSPSIEAQDVQR